MFKKFTISGLTAAVFILSFSGPIQAHDTKKDCELVVEQLFPDNAPKYGPRGFRGIKPERTDEIEAAATAKLIMLWGNRIYFVKSVDEIPAHNMLEPNIGNRGFYIVTDEVITDKLFQDYSSKDPQIKANAQKEVAALFNKLLDQGARMYWQDPNGTIHEVPHDFIRENFIGTKLEVDKQVERGPVDEITIEGKVIRVPRGENNLYVRGWFETPFSGGIYREDVEASLRSGKSTYNETARALIKLLAQGYTMRINTNDEASFKEILSMLEAQERTVKHLNTGEHFPVSDSAQRYKVLEIQENTLSAFKAGTKYGVEFRSPEGELLAGSIVNKAGKEEEPDTVSYKKIEYAQMLLEYYALNMFVAGYPSINTGMVTKFTGSMRAKYGTRERALQDRDAVPDDIKVNFTSDIGWLVGRVLATAKASVTLRGESTPREMVGVVTLDTYNSLQKYMHEVKATKIVAKDPATGEDKAVLDQNGKQLWQLTLE